MVVVLSLGKNSGSFRNSTVLSMDLFISIYNVFSCSLNISFNFLFNLCKLGILLLNLKGFLKLINLWELSEDLVSLLLNSVNLSHINLVHVMLVEHGLHFLLDSFSLLSQVGLKGVDALLD